MNQNNQYLSDYLTCKFCQKYFLTPVILPCGNNVCQEHVNQNIKINENTKKKEYECNLCQNNHKIPKNGFIINEPYIQMINNNLHLDERAKLAKKVFNDLDTLKKDIDLIVKDPENFIYSTFSKEKNKIDSKRETLISKIHDISEEMINEIKQLETNSKSNLNEIQKNLVDPNILDSNKLTQRVMAWNEEIRNPQLNKSRLEDIIEESKNLLEQIEKQSFKAKNKILNHKSCLFLPNKEEFKKDLFGELVIDDYKISNEFENPNSFSSKLDSNIVDSDQSVELIKLCEFDTKTQFKLLYRASRDGFGVKDFHEKCNNILKTLTLIKVKDKPHIFGGYTEATWGGDLVYKKDPNAFIFSLVNNDNKPIKMKVNENIQYAIGCHCTYGPSFGKGKDFHISSRSNSNLNSFSKLGHTYSHPNCIKGSNKAKSFLAGSRNFSTEEIEVYQVV
jgi:hypothetical protein